MTNKAFVLPKDRNTRNMICLCADFHKINIEIKKDNIYTVYIVYVYMSRNILNLFIFMLN